jgi:hypothetical protein
MFVRQKELERLEIPSQRVLRLQRSLSDVQLTLPGFPPQPATAYLCAFGRGTGVGVAVALHLHASRRVVFYLDDAGAASQDRASAVFNEGLQFAESMGFMLGDLDFQELSSEGRASLWGSVPLRSGDRSSSPSAPAVPPLETPAPRSPAPATAVPPAIPATPVSAVSPASVVPPAIPPAAWADKRRRFLENLGRLWASL